MNLVTLTSLTDQISYKKICKQNYAIRFLVNQTDCTMVIGGLLTRTSTPHIYPVVRQTLRAMSTLSKEHLWSAESKELCLKKLKAGPSIRIHRDPEVKVRTAAVLIPMCLNDQGEVSLLYTIRSSNLKRHVGEVAFPGGVKDEEDVDVIACALRETEEEIGVPRSAVKVWGSAKPILPNSNFLIHPVVGVIEDLQSLLPLKLCEDEVEDYFVVPLRHLCDPANHAYTQTRSGYTVISYLNAKAKIWGITGIITHSFLGSLLPQDVYDFDVPVIKKVNKL